MQIVPEVSLLDIDRPWGGQTSSSPLVQFLPRLSTQAREGCRRPAGSPINASAFRTLDQNRPLRPRLWCCRPKSHMQTQVSATREAGQDRKADPVVVQLQRSDLGSLDQPSQRSRGARGNALVRQPRKSTQDPRYGALESWA